jgi:hypothetical protein
MPYVVNRTELISSDQFYGIDNNDTDTLNQWIRGIMEQSGITQKRKTRSLEIPRRIQSLSRPFINPPSIIGKKVGFNQLCVYECFDRIDSEIVSDRMLDLDLLWQCNLTFISTHCQLGSRVVKLCRPAGEEQHYYLDDPKLFSIEFEPTDLVKQLIFATQHKGFPICLDQAVDENDFYQSFQIHPANHYSIGNIFPQNYIRYWAYVQPWRFYENGITTRECGGFIRGIVLYLRLSQLVYSQSYVSIHGYQAYIKLMDLEDLFTDALTYCYSIGCCRPNS